MGLTVREQKVLQEIREWENKMYECERNDFQQLYDTIYRKCFSTFT